MKSGLKDSFPGSRINWQKEDIYSMGALFYLILTGREPQAAFGGDSLSDISDPGLRDMLTSMISMDVQSRPDADKIEQDLEKLIFT